MATLDQAAKLISKAESELKTLLAQAAQNGEYDAVVALADWARTLSQLRAVSDGTSSAPELPSPSPISRGATSHPNRASASELGAGTRKRKPPGEYPKFVRDGDHLVKIAWSKTEEAEYEHKAPRSVVSLLVAALMKAGARDKLFAMETMFPLIDAGGVEVPSYQSYLALAWLRKTGLVLQHGRQGYSLKKGVSLDAEIAAAWEKLQQRRGV